MEDIKVECKVLKTASFNETITYCDNKITYNPNQFIGRLMANMLIGNDSDYYRSEPKTIIIFSP